MILRKAKETDFDKILLLYEHLYEEDIKAPKEDLLKIWNEILHNESLTYFIIEQDKEIICTCNITIVPNLTRGGKSFGIIENVVTHRDHRNKGFGKIIMEAAVDFAKKKNCYKVMLLSNSKRKEAHQFYRAIGFSSEKKVGFVMTI